MADADATIFAFPKSGISYNDSLYRAVEEQGAKVREGVWSGSWLLREMQAGDVMHVHWPSFLYYDPRSRWKTLVGLLRFVTLLSILRSRGVRIVWTAHNLYPHDGGRALWVHRFARRFVVRVADAVFVHGPSAARIVERELQVPARKLREIAHGHWIGYYTDTISRAEARAKLGLSATTYSYVFVGTCKPYKNLEELLRAFSRQPADTRLLIVGNFPSPDYLARVRALAATLGLKNASIEPRFIDDGEMQVYLRASDAVAIPYREILTSGSAMLALGFGRPVVVPRLGALVDVVDEKCGVLYDPDDPDGLSRALTEIRQRAYDEGHVERHARSFGWEGSAAALISIARSAKP